MALMPEQIGGALWLFFIASWVIVLLISWIYFRFNKDIGLKRRCHKRGVIIYGTMFFFLTALGMGPSFFLLIIGAAIVLIMYLNIRNTIFCDACGKTTYINTWFSRIEYCARCGAKLLDK